VFLRERYTQGVHRWYIPRVYTGGIYPGCGREGVYPGCGRGLYPGCGRGGIPVFGRIWEVLSLFYSVFGEYGRF